MKLIRSILTIFGLGCAAAAAGSDGPNPKTATSAQFSVGQCWRYKTRPGEESSRVCIGRIETISDDSKVVHIKIVGVKIRNRHAPDGFVTEMGHAPILESALAGSVTEKDDDQGDLSGLQEGYETWLEAYREGKGGVFSIPVDEIVAVIETTLSQRAA